MSFDQLETFLQDSDEKDYLPNVNDQEEYQKFLAAVLEEGAAPEDNKSKQDSVPEEDEDDDDGDFEAEIEEALENDREERNAVRRRQRVETRGRCRQRSQGAKKKRLPYVGTGQLRPLIPYVGGLTVVNCLRSGTDGDAETGNLRDARKEIPVSGFTAHQIGQLHSLIHEHVQLLIQVFALCILEPTRQQIAIDTHVMLIEIADKREAILSWKATAFPDFCFRLPYIHPSVTQDLPCHASSTSYHVVVGRVQGNLENTEHDDAGIAASYCPAPYSVRSTDSWCSAENGEKTSHLTVPEDSACHSATQWAPLNSGPVRSLLDVAPLSKVREFLADISTVVQHYRQRHVETGRYHSQCEREPLFGRSNPVQLQANSRLTNQDGSVALSPTRHGKESMAAALVESTKKQCTALVPKGVVKAIQIFLPLFNSALFPHKAPPPATTNRLLFTDSEDELLAMGLMTYNTDWKAIQQRFLPSKTMHQIFVRQKNRSSARAPENSIKAVKRLKLSALTPIERESICKIQGRSVMMCEKKGKPHQKLDHALKKFKHNWAKVWQYCVPYRDPAMLPRQWRIAHGTQKSYKMSGLYKERHRLYEANRRRTKSSNNTACLTQKIFMESTGSTRDASCSLDNERYLVHDAFLADWKPFSLRATDAAASLPKNTDHGRTRLRKRKLKGHMLEQLNAQPLQMKASGIFHQSPEISSVPPLPFYPGACLHEPQPNLEQGGHIHRKLAIRTVKLSPDLPSLNLPPNVLVMSNSMLDHSEGLINSKCHSNEGSGDLWLCQNQLSLLHTLADPLVGQIDGGRLEPRSHTYAGRQAGASSPKSSFNMNRSLVPKNHITSVNNQVTALNSEACPSDTTFLLQANMYHPKHNQIMLPDMSLRSHDEVSTLVCLSAGTSEQTVSQHSLLLLEQVAPKFHPFYCASSAPTTSLRSSS